MQTAPPLVEIRSGTSLRATVAVPVAESAAAPDVASRGAPAAAPAPMIAALSAPDAPPAAPPNRPAPIRTAVLAAFQGASRPAPAAAALPTPAVAAPAPPPMVAPMSPAARLSRVETAVSAAANGDRSSAKQSSAVPDLDALADYVLERLRGELRDGRERLGFLLDDSH